MKGKLRPKCTYSTTPSKQLALIASNAAFRMKGNFFTNLKTVTELNPIIVRKRNGIKALKRKKGPPIHAVLQ